MEHFPHQQPIVRPNIHMPPEMQPHGSRVNTGTHITSQTDNTLANTAVTSTNTINYPSQRDIRGGSPLVAQQAPVRVGGPINMVQRSPPIVSSPGNTSSRINGSPNPTMVPINVNTSSGLIPYPPTQSRV